MAITYIGSDSSQEGTNTTPITLNLPAHIKNDVGVIFGICDYNTVLADMFMQESSGWIELVQEYLAGGRQQKTVIWYKVFGSSNDANPVMNVTLAQEHSFSVTILRGVDRNNVFDATYTSKTATGTINPTPNFIVTSTNNACVVVQHGFSHDEVTAAGAPSGYTLNSSSVIGSLHSNQVTAYNLDVGTAGTISPGAFTHTGTYVTQDSRLYTLALKNYVSGADPNYTHSGNSTISVSANMAAAASVSKPANSTLSVSATVSTVSTVTRPASSAMSATVLLVGAPTTNILVTTSISTTTTLTAQATRIQEATSTGDVFFSTRKATPYFTAGVFTWDGNASFDTSVTIVGTAVTTVRPTSSITVSATLSSNALVTKHGSVNVSTSSTLDANALVSKVGSCTLSATTTLSADPIVLKIGSGSFNVSANVDANGLRTTHAAGTLSASADLSASAKRTIHPSVDINTSVNISAAGTRITPASSSIVVSASMTADGTVTSSILASGSFVTSAALVADVTLVLKAASNINVSTVISAYAIRRTTGSVTVGASAFLSASPFRKAQGRGTFSSTGTLTGSGLTKKYISGSFYCSVAFQGSAVTFIPSNLIVENGSAKSNANSYVSLSYVDSYHLLRGNTSWVGAQRSRESAIILATDYLEVNYSRLFRGATNSSGALAFPRLAGTAFYDNGREIEAVPESIMKTIAESALEILDGALSSNNVSGVKSSKRSVGSISESTGYGSTGASTLSYKVSPRFLNGILKASFSGRA